MVLQGIFSILFRITGYFVGTIAGNIYGITGYQILLGIYGYYRVFLW